MRKTNHLEVGPLLEDLDAVCRPQGLKIIPVRNYSSLPIQNEGRDIDIVIRRDDIDDWINGLQLVADKRGCFLRQGRQYKYSRQFHFVAPDGSELEIDLLPRFHWRGIDWLDEREVVTESVRHRKMIQRPRADHEFVITLNHSFLHGGFFPEKYKARLQQLLETNEDQILTHLSAVYGESNGSSILELVRSGNVAELNRLNRGMRIRSLNRAFWKAPIRFVGDFIGSYVYDFSLRFSRSL